MENESPYDDTKLVDPAKRAAAGVDAAIEEAETPEDIVIHDEKLRERTVSREEAARKKAEEAAQMVSAEEALQEGKVVTSVSDRQNVRVLILTQNVGVLTNGGVAQARILEYSKMFAEVHVVVLCLNGESTNEPDRIAQNVWLYPTNSSKWWRTPYDAYQMVKEQLVFGKGFRADLIIAEDAFESGAAAWYVGRKFSRVFEVHIFDDFFEPDFKDEDEHNSFRLTLSKFVLPRAACVRTATEFLKEQVTDNYPKLQDVVEVLPTYYNFDAWREAGVVVNLKELYPQFKFVVLHFSSMGERSHTEEVIDGLYYILRQYPTVGLIIVGDGPKRKALEERVASYELAGRIEFIEQVDEFVSYIKSTDVLVHTSQNSEDDKYIFCAGVVGTPMVAADTGLASTLFEDGESAFLCPSDSPPCIGEKVNRFMNEGQLRVKFERYAADAVKERVEQDYDAYLESYRISVERCLA
jgi:glycosyltransferase involved in cell wall biosynthesis